MARNRKSSFGLGDDLFTEEVTTPVTNTSEKEASADKTAAQKSAAKNTTDAKPGQKSASAARASSAKTGEKSASSKRDADTAGVPNARSIKLDHQTSLEYKEAQLAGTYREIPISALSEDDDNRSIYGDYETDGLASSIQENGFQGVIRAYPVNSRGTHFRIESGHRSLEAAKKAGLSYVPVVVTPAPASDVERRKRLVMANLHIRKYTPMRMAREAQYLFDTYKMMQAENPELTLHIPEQVAADMEISKSQVTKYRQLLNLIPGLQELADSGEISWSALAEASQLSESLQKHLLSRIQSQTKMMGQESVTRPWLKKEIDEYRYVTDPATEVKPLWMTYAKDAGETAEGKTRKRRIDGAKAVHKSSEALKSALSEDAMIKDKAKPVMIQELKAMRDLINAKLEELEQL